MALLYKFAAMTTIIYLTNGLREHYEEKHDYAPYYFTHKYFPKFSAWMMGKDEIYQHQFDGMDDSSDRDDAKGSAEGSEEGSDEEKYSEKTQLTAFLLAFFLGTLGAGRFYVGHIWRATIKLFFGLLTCLHPICRWAAADLAAFKTEFNICIAWPTLLFFVWWVVDLVLFGMNDITDGDGLTLESW